MAASTKVTQATLDKQRVDDEVALRFMKNLIRMDPSLARSIILQMSLTNFFSMVGSFADEPDMQALLIKNSPLVYTPRFINAAKNTIAAGVNEPTHKDAIFMKIVNGEWGVFFHKNPRFIIETMILAFRLNIPRKYRHWDPWHPEMCDWVGNPKPPEGMNPADIPEIPDKMPVEKMDEKDEKEVEDAMRKFEAVPELTEAAKNVQVDPTTFPLMVLREFFMAHLQLFFDLQASGNKIHRFYIRGSIDTHYTMGRCAQFSSDKMDKYSDVSMQNIQACKEDPKQDNVSMKLMGQELQSFLYMAGKSKASQTDKITHHELSPSQGPMRRSARLVRKE
jgi:hypothetical protein